MSNKQSLQEQIIRKAWENTEFKRELLINPRTAIQKELHMDIPEGTEIKVVEETAKIKYLVLPLSPAETKDVGKSSGIEPLTVGY